MFLDETMSQAEFDELERFLDSDAVPKDCMDLAALDGFLSAVAIGPVQVPPSEWLPVIWSTQGERAAFRSPDEEKRILDLVMCFYRDIVRNFSVDQPEFVPLLNHWLREEAKPYVSGEEWCTGFYIGLTLRSEDWQPLYEDEEHANLLDPILWFLDEEDRLEIAAGRDLESLHEVMLRSIVPSVLAINTYWKARRNARRQPGARLSRLDRKPRHRTQ
jgi:uncharacterized protein